MFLGTIGTSLKTHYCAGKLISFSIFDSPKKCCGGGCKSCENHSLFYKIKDNFVKQDIQIKQPVFTYCEFIFSEIIIDLVVEKLNTNFSYKKPPSLLNSRYILYNVFRI